MKQYRIPYCGSEPICWDTVPAAMVDIPMAKSEISFDTQAQLCWNEDGIYARLQIMEPAYLARFTGEYDAVWQDSCLEMFFCPEADDGRYFNFECNPNGAAFFGIGLGRLDRLRLHPWDIRERLSIRPFTFDGGWGVCFCIPVEVIRLFFPGFTLHEGHRMRGNFYTCGDDVKPMHELVWSPITNGKSDFHQSEFFGELLLTK